MFNFADSKASVREWKCYQSNVDESMYNLNDSII